MSTKRRSPRLVPSRPHALALSSQSRQPSPPAPVITLAELTPVQAFQKSFADLDLLMHKLSQFTPPKGSRCFIEHYERFRGRFAAFCVSAQTVLKQRILSSPLNFKTFEKCQTFRLNFPAFIESFASYRLQIPALYLQSLLGFFQEMEENFIATADACWRDPHTRAVWREYESSCCASLTECGGRMREIFDGDRYRELTPDMAVELSEKIKTLSRFFVTDLGRMLPNSESSSAIGEYRRVYHENLLKLVPMLTSIPGYRDAFEAVCEQVPEFSGALDRLFSMIGTTPGAIKLRGKPRLTSAQPVIPVVEIDPLVEPIDEFAQFLGCHFDDKLSAAEKIDTMSRKTQEIIRSLKDELNAVTKRLEILEPLNSKEVILDRFQQIRQFKLEMTQRNQIEQDKFMRDAIFRIRMLINGTVNFSESYPRQLRSIIEQLSAALENGGAFKQDLENGKTLLEQFVERGPLYNMTQEISKIIKESRSKLARFEKTLEGFGIHGSPEDCAVALARKQQQEKEQTDALEARIEAQERESAAFKYETMNVIGEIHSRLSKLCLCSMPAPQKLAEQRQEIRRYLEQLEGERKTLDSFVQELAVVLQLPPAPDLETGMAAIRQALVPPPKSDVFNTEPELGRLKPTTKDLLCRFCLSLIPDSPIENFQSKDTEYLVDLVSTKLTDCRQIEEFARAAVRGSDVSVERGVVSDSVYEFVQELRKGTDTQLASLREEIGQLKHSVSNKDAEISVLSSRMKQCQEQFLEYVKLAQGESDARSRRLQDIAAFFNSKD